MRILMCLSLAPVAILAAGGMNPVIQPAPTYTYHDAGIIHLPCGIDIDTRQADAKLFNISDLSSQRGGKVTCILHYEGPIHPHQRKSLEAIGADIAGYLPNYAYLVRMDAEITAEVSSLTGLDWIGVYEPSYKLSPDIDLGAEEFDTFTVIMYEGSTDRRAAAVVEELGGEVITSLYGDWGSLLRIIISPSLLGEIAHDGNVKWIEPYNQPHIMNASAQWVVQTWESGNRRIWDEGLTGEGQVISWIDSGLKASHNFFRDPDLSISGFDNYPSHRKVIAYVKSFSDPFNQISYGDENGHGTHTGGSLAGNDEPVGGSSANIGMAPDAKLYALDGGGGGSGIITHPNLEYSLAIPYEGNSAGAARIISLSWGHQSTRSYDAMCVFVDKTVWRRPDYLILSSAGNTSAGTYTGSPANAKNIIGVGGCQNAGAAFMVWNGSSIGPSGDGRIKPDLVVPGKDVRSAYASSNDAEIALSGTSMASPVAAGNAALVRQYFTDGYYPSGAPSYQAGFTPSAALLKATLINSVETDYGSNHVPDDNVGWGRPNLDNALYFPGDARKLVVADYDEGLETGTQFTGSVSVEAGDVPLRITVCWMDFPAVESASPALVNDLNLEVVSPSGKTYRGNNFSENLSVEDGNYDVRNTVENVFVDSPEEGEWSIHVHGNNVPIGPQPFALVVTGNIAGDFPSIAFKDATVDDEGQSNPDGHMDPGEEVSVSVSLTNSGNGGLTNVQASLSTESGDVTVTDNSSNYGSINPGQTADGDGFEISVSASAEADSEIEFQVDISADDYSSTLKFNLPVGAPGYEWTTHDAGNVRLTVSEQGAIGFYGKTPADEGNGFCYPSDNLSSWLYHACLAAGNSSSYVNDRFYGDNTSFKNAKDWEVTTDPDGMVIMSTHPKADQMSWAQFNDKGNWMATKGLTVQQLGYAWKDTDFVILKYILENPDAQTISDMYAGIIADFDMGYDASENRSGTNQNLDLAWTKQVDTDNPHVGVMLLEGNKANVSLLANPSYIYDTLQTGEESHIWNENTLFDFLSGELSFSSDSRETDWTVVVSAGPFDIASQASDTVAFAFLAGDNLSDLEANAQACRDKWEELNASILEGETPRPLSLDITSVPRLISGRGLIGFSIPHRADVNLEVFDLTGRKIRTLHQGELPPGNHRVSWDGLDAQGASVSKGVYFVMLSDGIETVTRKAVIVR